MTNLKQPVRSTATRRPFEARKSAKQGAPGVRKAGNIESNGGRRERNVCLVVRCNAREWPCKAGGGPPSLRPELLQGSSRDRTACTGRALWEARPSHTDPARSGGGGGHQWWWDPLSDNGAGPTRKFYGSRPDLSGLIHVDEFAQ